MLLFLMLEKQYLINKLMIVSRLNDNKALSFLYECSRITGSLLTEANLFSTEPLEQALEQLLSGKQIDSSSPIYNWFMKQYVNWFKSPADDQTKPVKPHEYKEGEPEWAKRKEIKDFAGFDQRQVDELNHIVDYFQTLDQTALKSLYKEPYPVIKRKVQQWDQTLVKKIKTSSKSPLKEGTDFKPIMNTKDGVGSPSRWVQLLTKAATKFEGDAMGHCVAGDSYKPTNIFSLYDEDNLPHVTIEADHSGKKIKQIKGKQNRKPVERYIPPTVQFIKALLRKGFKVTGDGHFIGMVGYDGNFYFEDSQEWLKLYKDVILPKQQKTLEEIKARIKNCHGDKTYRRTGQS